MAILFSILEIVTGVVSMVTPTMAIPPVLGIGAIIDIAILAVGLGILLFLGTRKGTTEDQTEDIVPPPPFD